MFSFVEAQKDRRRQSPRTDEQRPYVGVRLEPDQIPKLDEIAAQRGTYRATVIREAVAEYLARSA